MSFSVYAALGDGYLKVGSSGDVPRRVSNIQCGVPFELETIWTYPTCSDLAAVFLEKEIHKALKTQEIHLRGEWFQHTESFIDDALKVCARYPEKELKQASITQEAVSYLIDYLYKLRSRLPSGLKKELARNLRDAGFPKAGEYVEKKNRYTNIKTLKFLEQGSDIFLLEALCEQIGIRGLEQT